MPPWESDRIGVLPDEILHHVLSFLPSKGAVQTCLLARRWRHLWKSATGLRVGDGESDFYLRSVKENQEFLDHLLLLRNSAPLDTHALLCKVQFLQLYVSVGFRERFLVNELPLVSRHLTRLQLYGILLNDSFLNFSSCPALEHLVFDSCEFKCAKISSNSAKHLTITDSKFSMLSRVCIDISSLVSISLRLDDYNCRTPVLERMPSLVEAFVRVLHCSEDFCWESDSGDCGREGCPSCYGIKDNNNCVLLEGLLEAKTLVLINKYRSFIFKRDLKWCPTFTKLKTLVLDEYWCVPDDFSALACILEHAPILQNLILQINSNGPKHRKKIEGNCHQMDRSVGISGQLEIVEIRCEVVDTRVLKILKYLSAFNMPNRQEKPSRNKLTYQNKQRQFPGSTTTGNGGDDCCPEKKAGGGHGGGDVGGSCAPASS
uniref:F-box domain-containing protein n=1 Tax=Leersia perrieri TaxID=77586 RepID=A0A0D9XQ60_9ORYZ